MNVKEIIIITSLSYPYKLLVDCYVHLKDFFIDIMEENGIKVNIK